MRTEDVKIMNMENVINVAKECFSEYGIEATTLTMIAKRAGVTTRSVQRYFRTKSNLIKIAMEVYLQEAYTELKEQFQTEAFQGKNGYDQIIDILMFRA